VATSGVVITAGAAATPCSVPVTDGVSGTPRTGTVTRPRNMSVVWIMRVR
jgi:hypothetical protein